MAETFAISGTGYSGRIVQKVGERSPSIKVGPMSPIGMFDSGVGGLTVLKEVAKQLPMEDVIYFADTARVPYGGRTPNEIVKFNYEIINYLVSLGAKMIIMACGTSSAIAYPLVKDRYNIPIVSLIEPGSSAAVRVTKNKKIGLIATQATVDSSAYQRTIKRLNKDIKVSAAACPLFVPLIEGGFIDAEETKRTAVQYLKPLLKAGIDTLILGCTHYPHLIKILREVTGMSVRFVDPAEETVSEAKKLLSSKGLIATRQGSQFKDKYDFYVSGSTVQFQDVGGRLMGQPLANVKKANISKAGRITAAR
ncbi:MAG: glutamate racemase [Candidatus Margulisiibacteriota bacterium]